ncbi:DUF2637 domain-containing protein [Kitasatospora sp. NPDC051853]|uniref:DUF2637 domain-containing protein n=1 Tax=Kitasatospora sp. NPDC051853 TaxID=3364058 RepID=UPI00378E68B9
MARPSLTRAHRALLGVVAAGACLISGIGFAGSYNAVRDLAMEKGFGAFSYAFPIGVDAGIVVLLSLDLVLTWLRIPFPLLRQTAWLLTAATIAFNAAASWGDPLGMAMHAVIPVLFVVVVEASRHAVGRIAAITADRHMDSVRLMRWVLSPVPTFRLWRRMKLWELRSYDETVRLEQNRLVYRAQLRFRYGRGWRRSAPFQALLPLKLAKYGVPLDPSILDRIDGPLEGSPAEGPARGRALPVMAAQVTAGQDEVVAAPVAVAAAGAGRAVQSAPAQQQAPVQQAPVQQAPVQQAPAQQAPVHEKPVADAQAVSDAQVTAALAAPTLAKLAAVRLRDAQDPSAAEPRPVPTEPELNVWTARAVRSPAQPSEPVQTARVPGQPSPWFKAPQPQAEPVPAPGPVQQPQQSQQPEQPQRGPQEQPQVRRPVRLEQLAPQGVPAGYVEELPFEEEAAVEVPAETERRPVGPALPLDPEVCFEALTRYIEKFEQQPDPRQLADFLTAEYGLEGSGRDGSVVAKDVERVWPKLNERFMELGLG